MEHCPSLFPKNLKNNLEERRIILGSFDPLKERSGFSFWVKKKSVNRVTASHEMCDYWGHAPIKNT